jgi:hypothetical protein
MDPELVTNKSFDYIVNNPNFINRYMTSNSTLMFKFGFDEKAVEKIVKPFIEGKYSLIDRDYAKEHFNKLVVGGNQLSTNWMILNKHEYLKKYWEEQIGMKLPDDAEVWSRPEKHDEIYDYETNTTDEQHA